MTETTKKMIDGYMKSQAGLVTTTVITIAATVALVFYIDSGLRVLPKMF